MLIKRINRCGVFVLILMAVVTPVLAAQSSGTSKPLKAKLRGILKEIKTNRLVAWEREDSHLVTEQATKGYKVAHADGTIVFLDELPTSTLGNSKLYIKKNPTGFSFVITDRGRQYVWDRLHWHPEDKKWKGINPNYASFKKEEREVTKFLSAVTHAYDSNSAYRIPIVLSSIKRSRDEAKKADYIAELHQLVKLAGKGWGGSPILKQIYDLSVEIGDATIPQKLILAKRRRALLGRIVGLVNR